MAQTAADVLIERIIDWGIDTVFGLPGDGINGIMEALRTRQNRVRFIQVRHEEAAAFMACAYAKYTGRLGCCLATSGPGGIHLLNGLYDAKLDQAPVLAITGQTYSDLKGSNFQQEVNMARLFDDVAVYNQEVINPNQVAMLADEACRHALNHRGVAHITFPVDYQEKEPTGKGTMHKVEGATTSRWSPPVAVPPEDELKIAAFLLNEAKKPVILVGQGALGATAEVIEIADKLGAPVVKALLGKAVVPDDHPLTTGGLGLLGTTPSQEAMENADALLIIGSSFPYMEYLPKPDQAKGVQIDDKPDRIGLRFPVEVGLVGNAKPTVDALSRFIKRKEDRSFLEQAQRGMKDWWELMRKRAMRDDVPIKPQRVAWELSELAADDAIISTDSGTITTWIARQFKIRGSQKFSCSGTLATMAPGLPYAIAAKIAFPERQSIAFVGDGGFAMLMMEFLTAVKYNLPITVIIIKNNTLGQIKWEQIVFLGNPEYGCELHNPNFAKYAEACGGLGAKLAEAGFSVVTLDAGPHWSPVKDFVSDETASHKLYWTDERITGGDDPVELGSNNSGRGVGGSTVHYSMVKMRAHPEDFRRRTLEGELTGTELCDWPITFEDLEPYYEEVEEALQIAGPTFYPWGERRRRFPQREHELNASANMLVRGCTKLGIPVAPCPVSTLSAPHEDRPPCVYRGFCNYGCTTNAKSSILVTYIPRAIRASAEVRPNSMAAQIEHDESGHVTGVLHFQKGSSELFRQRAKNVIVAGYAIETPRLLLNSASALFPDGLANSSGMVGRCFMVHSGHQVFAKFPYRINQYKAPPGLALTEHFNRTMPDEDFICGYTIETVGPHPVDFAARIATARGLWGVELRRKMLDYNYYSGIGIVGEILPQERNLVKLHETERDQYGLPIPHIIFSYHDNDRRIIEHAITKMKEILKAAGGNDIWEADRTAHLLGTCRMGHDPKQSVVNGDCRAHDVPNLFVCDGSVFPTSAAVNPSLTIEAIAARTADRIIAMAR